MNARMGASIREGGGPRKRWKEPAELIILRLYLTNRKNNVRAFSFSQRS